LLLSRVLTARNSNWVSIVRCCIIKEKISTSKPKMGKKM